jgi:hypothetical protein
MDEYKDLSEEEYSEPEEQEDEYEEYIERVQSFIAPENVYTSIEGPGGIRATTAAGALGKLLRRQERSSQTDEERMIEYLGIFTIKIPELTYFKDIIIRNYINTNKIPDLKYKSPAGLLLGYIGYKDNITVDSKNFKKVSKILQENILKINELDIIRYARAFNIWSSN